ncbi:hypothetical protein [Aeromicrobium sp. HA]|uniref:hypothetical protein n=1 Tax=Aeromicrobium sp. HA TaxID=3009077 RepID=UPI0022AE82BE|nr:hypothetical protein [Aeromicrobium sp. HA]
MTDATTHHSECLDCEAKFADKNEADVHMRETFDAAPVGADGWSRSGHRTRVVNPTPEERAEIKARSTVSWAVSDAVDGAIDSLIRKVDRGDITAEEVRHHLRSYSDFIDAWDEAQE